MSLSPGLVESENFGQLSTAMDKCPLIPRLCTVRPGHYGTN